MNARWSSWIQQVFQLRLGVGVLFRWGLVLGLWGIATLGASAASVSNLPIFPPPLESYGDSAKTDLIALLKHRMESHPFNAWATLLFLAAILHTFFAGRFRHWSHSVEIAHEERYRKAHPQGPVPPSSWARLLHFLGDVEVVFGLWAIPLMVCITSQFGWAQAVHYVGEGVSYHEAVFVVVIMAIAATRPVLRLAEQSLEKIAALGGGRPVAWWFSILTLGPLLGSFMTEPAAMTISASLLARRFYIQKPSSVLGYATLGLLFVNVSVGGTLTHFAAPPVLMVVGPWGWDTSHMLHAFGWKAALSILIANACCYALLRPHFQRLQQDGEVSAGNAGSDHRTIPIWVTAVHLLFMVFSVLNAHHPVLLIGALLVFLAFQEISEMYQSPIQLRPALLVGFFLAGLVIHGGLQGWWIAPLLGSLSELPLLLSSIGLTAFNDNAAITFLATLVPNLTDTMKYAVVAGAVTGGGLTVIANAPNPAGQAILGRFFPDGISPLGLLLGALVPTLISGLCFWFFRTA